MGVKAKASENFWSVVETFTGRQGRKVAFGFVGFWVATALLREKLITSEIWWWVFLTAASLVGFGTILDTFMEKLGDKISGFVADKVNKVVETTKTETTTEVTTPAVPQ